MLEDALSRIPEAYLGRLNERLPKIFLHLEPKLEYLLRRLKERMGEQALTCSHIVYQYMTTGTIYAGEVLERLDNM